MAERQSRQVILSEIRKAREALEAKGAFIESNAATHLVRALEAMTQNLIEEEALQQKFFATLHARKEH